MSNLMERAKALRSQKTKAKKVKTDYSLNLFEGVKYDTLELAVAQATKTYAMRKYVSEGTDVSSLSREELVRDLDAQKEVIMASIERRNKETQCLADIDALLAEEVL